MLLMADEIEGLIEEIDMREVRGTLDGFEYSCGCTAGLMFGIFGSIKIFNGAGIKVLSIF